MCNPHPEELAWVLVFDHPWATVTDASGGFSLADVPSGSHDLWVFQGGRTQKWGAVEVGSGSVTEIVVNLEGAGAAE